VASAERSLSDLLAAGERDALRGTPAAALAPLREALELASAGHQRAEGLAAGWLLGVAFGACGRYGEAFDVLGPLTAALGIDDLAGVRPGAGAYTESAPLDASTTLFGAFSAATAASLHRQLGRHLVAQPLDLAGWSATTALGAAADEARIDCGIGLAADAVGLGESDEAKRWAQEAREIIEARSEPGWRPEVRLRWVESEIALLDDDPYAAVEKAQEALHVAERARAPRHVAKSVLFQGVAQATAGDEAAVATLRRASALAESLAALPLVWPARAMLGALLGGASDPEGARSLAAASKAVREIAAGLPAVLHDAWLARPDVAALLATEPDAPGT
jgi:hypothetical protein